MLSKKGKRNLDMTNNSLSRRDFMKTSAAGVVVASDIAKTKGNTVSKRRPNLLFVMTDQQPIRGVGAYGASVCRTPNIDQIAATGMRFDQFHVAAFPCSPSRATMLTGLYSHSHGHVTNELLLTEEIASLGTYLEKSGYNTGYVGKWHLGGNMYRPIENQPSLPEHPAFSPFILERVSDNNWFKFETIPGGTGEDEPSNGWNHWVGGWKHYRQHIIDKGMGGFLEPGKWHLFGGHHIAPTRDGETLSTDDAKHIFSAVPEEHHECAFLADEATRFLEAQRNDDNPFALVLSFYGPHHPVAPPKPWNTMYGLDEVCLPDNFDDPLDNKPSQQRNDKYYRDEWSEEQYLDYIRRYWGYCSYIDEQIGKTLRKLDEIGEADNTIVIFTSDHGDMVGGHGMVWKNILNGYDELMRVPFIIRYPGYIESGAICDTLASSVDLLATLSELMGFKLTSKQDGTSFAQLLRGDTNKHRDIVFTSNMYHNYIATTNRWKFSLSCHGNGPDELYDRVDDPGEITNLIDSPEHQEIIKDMRKKVYEWLDETDFPYMRKIHDFVI